MLVSKVVGVVVSCGVAQVVSNVAGATMNATLSSNASKIAKVLTVVGAVAIGAVAGDYIGTKAEHAIDDFAEQVNAAKENC